ncbi:MAG: spore coat associated protein CotJA, partial [Eubacteriales bacterium]|nr:spore coat associated protein CotJA [Eubacteriales bacterium]
MNNIKVQSRRGCDREPYVGMPIRGNRDYDCYQSHEPKCSESACDAVDVCPLGMAYVPMQRWGDTYAPEKALHRGTIFPDLDLPFLGGGAF